MGSQLLFWPLEPNARALRSEGAEGALLELGKYTSLGRAILGCGSCLATPICVTEQIITIRIITTIWLLRKPRHREVK